MKKILIVDDSVAARIKLRKFLAQAEYEIVGEAANGLDALNLYIQLKPDVVIMDLVMPEMDGIEAARHIVAKYPSAKIIFTSIIHQKEMLIKALESGASSYIEKPFEKDRVLRTIEQVLKD